MHASLLSLGASFFLSFTFFSLSAGNLLVGMRRVFKNPLHAAVAAGNISKLEACLSGEDSEEFSLRPSLPKKELLNCCDEASGYTPLQLAINSGQFHVVKYLIAAGVDLNRAREAASKDTALTIAAKKGDPDGDFGLHSLICVKYHTLCSYQVTWSQLWSCCGPARTSVSRTQRTVALSTWYFR